MADEAAAAAAASVASDMLGDFADEATPATSVVVEQTGAANAVEPEQDAAPDIPSFEADMDGIEDIFDEPDDPEFELEDDQDDEPVLAQENEYDDPDVARLKARLAKAEKQLKYQQDLRAKDNLKGWRAEAARRFPLSDAADIEASSRRAVLKKAKEQHDRYQRKLSPVLDQIEGLRQSVIQETKEQARREATQAWGRPTSGPQVATVEAAEASERVDRSKYRSAHEIIAARIRNGFQI